MMALPIISPTRRVEPAPDGGATVYVKPPAIIGDHPEVAVVLTADQFRRYQRWRDRRGLIQHLLYDLSDDAREKLQSGLTDL